MVSHWLLTVVKSLMKIGYTVDSAHFLSLVITVEKETVQKEREEFAHLDSEIWCNYLVWGVLGFWKRFLRPENKLSFLI